MKYTMENTSSTLIGRLNALASASLPGQERRTARREPLPAHLTLEMRREDGGVYEVTPDNVSGTGVAFICRNPMRLGESIGLRLVDQQGKSTDFETGEVVHIEKQDSHYLVGVVLQ